MKNASWACAGLGLAVLLMVVSHVLILEGPSADGKPRQELSAAEEVSVTTAVRLPQTEMADPLFQIIEKLAEPVAGDLGSGDPSAFRAVTRSCWVDPVARTLETLNVGDSVSFPDPWGDAVRGKVTFREMEGAAGVLQLAGVLQGVEGSRFFMRISAGSPMATLLLPGEKRALLLEPASQGRFLLQEIPIHAVMCFGMPLAPDEHQSAAGSPDEPLFSVLAPALDSLPGATEVLYLDFDGETVTDPAWNSGGTIVAAAATLAGQPISQAQMTEVWEMVAEDFRPFNVSVTTMAERYTNAPINRRMRCIVTPTNTAAPGSGGVAYLNSFSRSVGSFSATIPCWSFNQGSTRNMAMTISHELGHTLGLRHDGRISFTTEEVPPQQLAAEVYYAGHGTGATSWGPIMGAPFNRPVTQWSKGEYFRADQTEDDVALIARPINTFGYRADEAGGTPGTASVIPVGPGGTVDVSGLIHSDSDKDYYRFVSLGGVLTVSCSPNQVEPNLKVRLELRDASDQLVASAPSESANTLGATLQSTLASGVYYLVLSSGAFGDPMASYPEPATGFTSYGSVGGYRLVGSLPGGPAITPLTGILATGESGGTFAPALTAYTVSNTDTATIQWSVAVDQPWLELSQAGGTLSPGGQTQVVAGFSTAAGALSNGTYLATITFTNESSGATQTRGVTLVVGGSSQIAVEQPDGTSLITGAATVNFGAMMVGSREGRRFALRNTGDGALHLGAMTLTGASGSYRVGAATVNPVPAGEVAYVDVVCEPAGLGAQTAVLSIASNASNHPVFQVTLKSVGTVAAGSIHLTRGISQEYAGLNPATLVSMGDYALFVGTDPKSGAELWRSDGTGPGTYQLADIYAGAVSSSLSRPVRAGALAYFSAANVANGHELWVTDGTAAGTRLVRDIQTGTIGSAPNNLTVMNGLVYFSASTIVSGGELWRSNGTTAGTVMVKEIRPGLDSSQISNLVTVNGLLFFTAHDGVNGTELWRSDGTEGGTTLVKDIRAGADGSSPFNLTVVGSSVYFSAFDGANGTELWKSDGTQEGTVMVKDIVEGGGSASPTSLVAMNGVLYFRAITASTGFELWRSDGTADGTVMVKDINPGSVSGLTTTPVVHENRLYFQADSGSEGGELWTSDGTEAGTFLLKDVYPGGSASSPASFAVVGSTLFFVATTEVGRELWKTDGTLFGTVLVKDISPGLLASSPSLLTPFGSLILFVADDGLSGRELWRSDGTAVGTYQVGGGRGGIAATALNSLRNVNGTLYFSGNNGVAGAELWRSDGSLTGTTMVKDIYVGTAGSLPGQMTALSDAPNSSFVFAATSAQEGTELRLSDGTESGTQLVRDIMVGTTGSSPTNFLRVGSTVYFSANDGVNGAELWKTDGTAAGTMLVADINPGSAGSSPTQLVNLNGILIFSAVTANEGQEIWRSDGTEAGTFMLRDINDGSLSSTPLLVQNAVMGNELLFSAASPSEGRELWKTNGTVEGTTLVRDIHSGLNSSSPASFASMGDKVIFSATDASNGLEIWLSDGTFEGTFLIKDINPSLASSSPSNLIRVGGLVFFSAFQPSLGTELWKTDGTPNGTEVVRDLAFGTASSSPVLLTNANGTLIFRAATDEYGAELWTSDGSSSGTRLVADLFPGADSSSPSNLTAVGSRLFFTAMHPQTSTQLFVVDTQGPAQLVLEQPAGTPLNQGDSVVSLASVTVGSGSSRTFRLVNAGWNELILSIPGITGTNAEDFALGALSSLSIPPGEAVTLEVSFNPRAVGARSAVLNVMSNDSAWPVFQVGLSGEGLPVPSLVVEQPAEVALVNGVSGVSFGAVQLGAAPAIRAFRLRNGTAATTLLVTSATLSGVNAAEFSVEDAPVDRLINDVQFYPFTVRFAPRGLGVRSATLTIQSSDSLTPAFSVTLTGSGVAVPGPVQQVRFDELPARQPGFAPFMVSAFADSGLPLSYEVLAGPVTVSSSGMVTHTGGSGAVTIRLVQAGGAGFDPAQAFATFSISDWTVYGKISSSAVSNTLVGLRPNGTLWSWGFASTAGALGDPTSFGRATAAQIGVVSTWAEAKVGNGFGLAIRNDGTLWGWGLNSNGQLGKGDVSSTTLPVQVATGRSWRTVSAGSSFAAGIAVNGTLWTWGLNTSGQLGLGDTTQRLVPVQVGSENNWAKVTCGSGFMVALKSNGELWSWGVAGSGQLGTGNFTQQIQPVRVGNLSDWTDVAAGASHVLALRADGSLWAWGSNSFGQLGNGTLANQSNPVQVGQDSDWDQISGGNGNSVARKRNGTVWAWGDNQYGQLGETGATARTSPQLFSADGGWASIQAGIFQITALRQDGRVFSAGENFGFTGVSPRALARTAAIGNWQMLKGNGAHFMAVRSDGSLWGWGRFGNFGNNSFADVTALTQHGVGETWSQVAAGAHLATNGFTLGIRTNGTLWATGTNLQGTLGDGTTLVRHTWVQVGSESNWSRVAAGQSFSLGVRTDGTLWSWGANGVGQLGLGTSGATLVTTPTRVGTGTQWTDVAAGYGHAAAIRSDGTLWTWGNNTSGQLGVGDSLSRTSPVRVGNDSDWVAVACGGHTWALKANGSLWAWGSNSEGQLGVGDTAARLVPVRVGAANHWAKIAVGRNSSAALTTEGALWAAGESPSGQSGNGETALLPAITEIARGGFEHVAVGAHSVVALRSDGSFWTAGTSGASLLEGGRSRSRVLAAQYALSPQVIVTPPVGAFSGRVLTSSGLPARIEVISGPGEVNGDEVANNGPVGSVATFLAWHPGDEKVWNAAVPVQFSIIRAVGEIRVFEGSLAGTELQNGQGGVVYGTVLVGAPATRTFAVSNQGQGPLVLSGLSASGDWTLNLEGTSLVVPSGGSTTFTATFTPAGPGLRTGQISVPSNDEDAPVFVIPVSGTGGLAQSITFNSIPTQVCGTPLVLSATSSSGLPVKYAVTSGASVAVLENGVLNFVASGSVTIQATQSGDTTYAAAAPINRSFSVIRGNQVLTFSPDVPSSISHRGTVTLAATSDRGLTPVIFSRISGPGTLTGTVLTFTGPGAVVVRASQAGNAAFNTSLQEKTITATNSPPLGLAVTVEGNEDSVISGQLSAADADGDPQTFSKFSDPVHGTVVIQSNGAFSYSPHPNYSGPDSFRFRAFDGFAFSEPTSLSVTVLPVNDAPMAVAQSLQTPDSVELEVILTGADLEDDDLTFEIVQPPTHGTLTGNPPRVIYLSEPGYAGPDQFLFRAKDGQANSLVATVDITVTPVGITFVSAPANLALSPSGNGEFKVVVAGTRPVTYQWNKNGEPLVGQVSDTLVISQATQADVAIYSCTASNEVGSVTSEGASLELVRDPPRIVEHPQHALIQTHGELHLKVVALGSPPLRYQWKRNGKNIPGATGPNLSFWDVTLATAGGYSVIVTSTRSVESAVAQVGVVDDMLNVQVLEEGSKAVLRVGSGGAGLSHAWMRQALPLPAEPRFKTSADGRTLTIEKLQPSDAGMYHCRVEGPGGSITGAATDLGVFNSTPSIETPQQLPDGIVGGRYTHQIRVAPGEGSRPSRFVVSGLPPGVKVDVKTGLISGQPTKPGFFTLRMAASNRRSSPSVSETIEIAALPPQLEGSYTGLIARSAELNEGLGGTVSFTINKTAAYSGKVVLGGVRLPFKGFVEVDKEGQLAPTVMVKIPRLGKPAPQPVTLEFDIHTTPGQLSAGRLTAGAEEAEVQGWRQSWHQRSNPAVQRLGYHTFALESLVAVNDPLVPQGSGYGSFSITPSGSLRLTGRLGDGTAMTQATSVGPQGEIGLFGLLYGPGKAPGSLLGKMTQGLGLDLNDPKDNRLGGNLTWSKPNRQPRGGQTYPAGFGPLELAVSGGYFQPPVFVLGVSPGLGNAELVFSGGGVELSATNPDVKLSTNAANRVFVEETFARVSLEAKNALAGFSGGFQLLDNHWSDPFPAKWTRKVRFQGLFILTNEGYSGHGYFLVPELPFGNPRTNPPLTLSGRVLLRPRQN